MKKKLLLLVMCLATSVAMMAQKSYNFNAVALNVDGLPNEIFSIEINPDGKEAAGATELCGIIANSGWDIVGLSEDFNFHSELTAAPASTYYNFGAHGGGVSGLSNSTDGLGFACAKRFTMAGGTKVPWTEHYGETDHGADGLITKGFRVYNVTLAQGIVVDVYVLHMDAEDSAEDIAARKTQLTQLATYIKNNHNGCPVIILGDTNCRYTRDELKTAFVDVINADPRFTINDAWVELMWGGTYPTYGSESMMTHTYGDQKGEVVDKIFYINTTTASNLTLKANSYLHNTKVGVSDHYPVVVNFTLTDSNGTPLTDAEKENSWLVEEGSAGGNKKPTWEGDQVVSGTTYFIMNVGTGEYVKWGGWWNAQAVSGYAGHPVTPTLNNGKYELVTNASEGRSISATDSPFMDNTDHTTWTLTPVEGTSYQYYIEGGNGALTTTAAKELKTVAKNANDDNQKWIFVSKSSMSTVMQQANGDYPFNFTPLLGAADFDVYDDFGGYAKSSWTNFESAKFTMNYVQWGAGMDKYNSCASASNTSAVTISQSLGTLPKGTYEISFEGFYRSRYKPLFSSEKDETRDAKVTFGSTSIAIPQNTTTTIGSSISDVAAMFRDTETYATKGQATLSSATSVTLTVSKPATSSTAKAAWICIDNFRLMYYGTGEVTVDPNKEYRDAVCAKVNETYEKVILLNEAGQAAYDISVVVSRYNNDQITSGAIAQAMCDIVDAAYANAYAAHNAKVVSDVVANMNSNGGDVTGAIINASFETGDLTGWTVSKTDGDVGVYPNSNGTYTASGCDKTYLFNSWGWPDEGTSSASLSQTIKGLPNGLYELKASLTSFGKADGKPVDYTVFLTANSRYVGVAAANGKTVFQEATLYFLVEDGTAEIGAVGGDGTDFNYFDPRDGSFFKADNFRLKYICDVPNGRLKLALDEVKATPLDYYGQAALDIAAYETKFANKTATGDGKSDANAVYAAMKTATKAQKTVNADMTWAIENPSFETGEFSAWSTTVAWDTRVAPQNSSYVSVGAAGAYLFNTWNDYVDATNSGVNAPITQTISGLPNGTYQLTAMMASDGGNTLYVSGNGTQGTVAAQTADFMKKASVEFAVTNGTATISAGGNNNCWYKVDDFHLTYLGNELTLEETATTYNAGGWYTSVTVNRTIAPEKWSTFVVPFNMSIPDGWTVKKLSGTVTNGDNLTLQFSKADAIEAGIPYMVFVNKDVNTISANNVEVLDYVDSDGTSDVDFIGTYTAGNVPLGHYFISNNTFYKAAHENNTIKGFRATFEPAGSYVKSIGYTFDEDGFTAIEGVEESGVTIEAVYGVDGALRAEMQKGINIVKMSNGTVKKVLVK